MNDPLGQKHMQAETSAAAVIAGCLALQGLLLRPATIVQGRSEVDICSNSLHIVTGLDEWEPCLLLDKRLIGC